MRNLNNRDESDTNMLSRIESLTAFISLLSLVELVLELFGVFPGLLLGIKVLLFGVAVVERIVHVLVIVNPSAINMGILLMKVNTATFPVEMHSLIVANLIGRQCSRSAEQHFTLQVRVRTRLVHGSVGLEIFLNVELVLLKHGVDLQIIVGVEDLLKIFSHTVLLVMEAVNVRATNSEHLLGKELSDHTPITSFIR
jgi:hypothetical protein